MEITYCDGWIRTTKQYTETLSEAQARQAHAKGQLYTVLIGDPQSPDCFIDVNLKLKFIGVTFLDDFLRDYLDYSFVEAQAGKLFLDRAIFREYDDNSDTIVGCRTFLYKPDGTSCLEEADLVTNQSTTTESILDISKNWEAIPAFGDYHSISRIER
jgi:hypothetical protein